MKLSLVFELLLIFVLLAFAASKHVGHAKNYRKGIQKSTENTGIKIEDNSINKYCKCSETLCNCCRDFAVPVINLYGPGCASLTYLNGDKMAVSLSFGRKVITNRTLSSKNPIPVCMPLPGGVSKFCGRVYNIARIGEEFRACLSLELQAKSVVEAAVRVSCFKFGPRGVTSEPADPLPLVPQGEKVKEDDDDDDEEEDDEDEFGLVADDDDDEDDDGELGGVNDVESADYTGFSLLGEDILDDLFGSTGTKKNKKPQSKKAYPSTTTTTTTTKRPQRPNRRPSRRPLKTTSVKPTTIRNRPNAPGPNRRPVKRPLDLPSATTTESVKCATSIVLENIDSPIEDNKAESSSNVKAHVMSVIPITTIIPPKTVTTTTPIAETTLDQDDGLESSLAHITGQLSLFPVTQIIPTQQKDSHIEHSKTEQINFERVETITLKPHSMIPFATTVEDHNAEEQVKIVDSQFQEHLPDNGDFDEQTRMLEASDDSNTEEITLPKNNHNGGQFTMEDLDVLDLTEIGESVGHQLGIFGRHKRQNKNKENKPHNMRGRDEYDDILGLEALSDTLGLPDIGDIARKDRRRQNKMMRGWSQTQ